MKQAAFAIMIAASTILLIIIAYHFVEPDADGAAVNEHYEDGTLIRTIRGQDFIVSGSGSHETLIPIGPSQEEIIAVAPAPLHTTNTNRELEQ
jgi:hypothetical protein